jgi:flagellin-like protein
MNRKGISPLVGVVMLIAVTLIVSGILATWVTQLAESQRGILQYCIDADVILQGARYDDTTQTLYLYVDNRGTVDLSFTRFMEFSDDTAPVKNSTIVKVPAGELVTITEGNVPDTLSEVTIQSEECKGIQDLLQRRGIKGLGF